MDLSIKMFENLKYALAHFEALGEPEGHPNGRLHQRYWAMRDYSNGYRIECVVIEESYAYKNKYYTYHDGYGSLGFRIGITELMKFMDVIFPTPKQENVVTEVKE